MTTTLVSPSTSLLSSITPVASAAFWAQLMHEAKKCHNPRCRHQSVRHFNGIGTCSAKNCECDGFAGGWDEHTMAYYQQQYEAAIEREFGDA